MAACRWHWRFLRVGRMLRFAPLTVCEAGRLIVVVAHLATKGNAGPSVEEYYSSVESRLGYFLILGNARHCGLWEPGTLWPFPISRVQRAMEEKLYQRLTLGEGSKVLDAGAGSGVVASYMAETHGL